MAKCSRILLLTLSFQALGILIPYLLALRRSIFRPQLPFISQTTGFSPECGIFAFLLIPGSFIGAVLCFMIHSIFKFEENKRLKIINKLSFLFNFIYYFSWVLICVTPITFTDLPNKHEWVFTVLILHMIGALLMLFSIIVFVVAQTILFWNSEIHDRSNKYRKCVAIITVFSAAIGIIALINVGFEELSSTEDVSMRNITYYLPTELSFSYITTALCEWSLILSYWFFLLTFYNKMEQTDLRISVRKKQEHLQVSKKEKTTH